MKLLPLIVLTATLAAASFAQTKPCVPVLPEDTRRQYAARLAAAQAQRQRAPQDPDALIWAGRRLAYLNRFDEAIALYTAGLVSFPDNPKIYRHRGHRFITLRNFSAAVTDLEKAARLVKGRPDEIEPDGLPNARNIPTGTLNSNIYYHLGLAHYLRGDFQKALQAYRECLKFSKNADMLTATTHWLYMTLRRLGRKKEAQQILAPISPQMDIIENGDYHRLLLMYKGQIKPEELLAESTKNGALSSATVGYGVANWHFYNGQRAAARRLWQTVTGGTQCNGFGYVAAEAELNRIGVNRKS
jgi:tetratricopeptide (TPR) repeat protein